jgi:hypothetical protein
MWNKKTLYVMFLICSSLILGSCRAKKPLLDTEEQIFTSKSKADTIVKNLVANNFQFDNLKAKINTRFKRREKQNLIFGTFLKMKRDSIIHATISVAGFPIVVAYITPDSLKFLNKRDQKYFIGDFSYVSKMLNTEITFNQLQNLLVGNPLVIDTNQNYYLVQEENDLFLSSLSRNELRKKASQANKKNEWIIKYWINELYKTGKTIISNDSTETSIEVFQADYKKIEGQNFPNRTKAQIITKKDSISVNLNYQRVKINLEMDYTFVIPSHYTAYENL